MFFIICINLKASLIIIQFPVQALLHMHFSDVMQCYNYIFYSWRNCYMKKKCTAHLIIAQQKLHKTPCKCYYSKGSHCKGQVTAYYCHTVVIKHYNKMI